MEFLKWCCSSSNRRLWVYKRKYLYELLTINELSNFDKVFEMEYIKFFSSIESFVFFLNYNQRLTDRAWKIL